MADEAENSRSAAGDPGAEAEFPFLDGGAFPTRKDLEAVLSLSGKERLVEILNAPDPAELVAQMPALDVFLTIKDLGLADALELIGLATPEQIIHFLDLDLWKKDRLQQEGIVAWLEMLEACGGEKLRQILEAADPELVVAVLGHCLRVRKEEKREEDQGKKEGEKGFTLDRIYYLEFRDPSRASLLTRILKDINQYDPAYYQDLLDRIYWSLPAEEEEAALRWRKGRLADQGFPDFTESLEIYRYLPPESRREPGPLPNPFEASSWIPPGYLERAGQGSFLFEAAGRALTEEQIGRVKSEMVHLANQVLVAAGADPGDPEAIKTSSVRAFQTLDLGLRHLSGEDPDRAARTLESLPVFRIFQTGFSLGLDLRFKAEALFMKTGWFGAWEGREEWLDSPYREIIQGLLLKHPLYFDPAAAGNYRPFRTLVELSEVEGKLHSLEVLGRIFSRWPGYSAPKINALRRMPLYFPGSLLAVLLTGLARWILTEEAIPKPLTVPDLEGIGPLILDPARSAAWVATLESHGGLESREEEEVLHDWLTLGRTRLVEEIGRIPPGHRLDPRYVSLLLVER